MYTTLGSVATRYTLKAILFYVILDECNYNYTVKTCDLKLKQIHAYEFVHKLQNQGHILGHKCKIAGTLLHIMHILITFI